MNTATKTAWIGGSCAIVAAIAGGIVGAYFSNGLKFDSNPNKIIDWTVDKNDPQYTVFDNASPHRLSYYICVTEADPRSASVTPELYRQNVGVPERTHYIGLINPCTTRSADKKILIDLLQGDSVTGTVQLLPE